MRLRLAALFLIPLLVASSPTALAATAPRAPELPRLDAGHWLNSPPLTLASLRGRPVLIEFWTFGCSNCRNTLPWLERVHARYAPEGLTIVAVHTPEFDNERGRNAIAQAVDAEGRIVDTRIGELHAGDRRADIARLLGVVR